MDVRSRERLTVLLPSDREIVLTRVFAAPRRLVFEAWTKPEHVKRWYGCSAVELIACEIDLRVGGGYRYTLRAPDGVEHTMHGVYREIVAPERLVYTERYVTAGFAGTEALVTVILAESGGITALTSTSLYPSRADRDGRLQTGMERGTAETLDRLEELLETISRG